MSLGNSSTAAHQLLDWYDRHRRRMPWRALPGDKPDPYHVWLSEIMLQQTTVVTVGPYFEKFIGRWPTVEDLAAAELDEVLQAWAGLGYYARARNLHKCAGVIARDHGGRFPEDEISLKKLPGIGPYTAAAVSAIAFDRPAAVMDGNVERVMARLFSVTDPLPQSKPVLYDHTASLTPGFRPGDYAQAVMDLGATVCTVRKPKCMLCPWTEHCSGKSIAETLPVKKPKPERPTRRGIAFWITRPDGSILLRRRPEKGLLGGMMEVPSSKWSEGKMPDPLASTDAAPMSVSSWQNLPGTVRHTFTHFHLELAVLAAQADAAAPTDCVWCMPDALGDQALPTVMRKIVKLALKAA